MLPGYQMTPEKFGNKLSVMPNCFIIFVETSTYPPDLGFPDNTQYLAKSFEAKILHKLSKMSSRKGSWNIFVLLVSFSLHLGSDDMNALGFIHSGAGKPTSSGVE